MSGDDGLIAPEHVSPWSFVANEGDLAQRAVELARSMAAVKCRNKYPVGVIGKEARAHYSEARQIASRIEARSDETPQEVRPEGQEPDPKGTPNPLSHAEAKQPALSTGPTPTGNSFQIGNSSPTPSGVGPTSIKGASK